MGELTVVGKSVKRLDALEKVTGRTIYCTDEKLPGMLFAKAVRSPYPHARILSIDASRAERLAGVKAVATGKDVRRRAGAFLRDQHIIATERVRFVGDIVAAVAAASLETAEEAAGLIDVEYEQLPAVMDVEEAIKKQPPAVLHPELATYDRIAAMPYTSSDLGPNVFRHFKVRNGDMVKGFAQADVVVSNRYSTARIQHCQMEPHASIARVEPDGSCTVWTGKGLWGVRRFVCWALDLPPSKVRVIGHNVGGSFGGKVSGLAESIALLLAQKARRPVRIVLSRDEMFVGASTRIPMVVYIKDGVTRDGRLVARQMEVLLAGGAYADHAASVVRNCAFGASGTYSIPNFMLDSYAVYVNQPLGGPFRGYGASQVVWAIEQQMDILAEEIGIDPEEIRRRNLLKEGGHSVMGELVHSIGAEECLDKVARGIGWQSKATPVIADGPWRRAKGIAIGNKYSWAPATASAVVKVLEDGTIEVLTSADEVGQGARTVLSQIAAEEFQVDVQHIKWVIADTGVTPYDDGAISSRQTFNTGNAIRLACQDAKRQLFEAAAVRLEVSPRDLKTANGRVFVEGSPDRGISVESLFATSARVETRLLEGAGILGKGIWRTTGIPEDPETGQSEKLCSFYTHGATAVDVAVNVETGEVKVERIYSAFDTGRAVNPRLVEAQIEGGVGMGIGASIYEEMLFDEGHPTNTSFMDYKIPTITEIPSTENVVPAIVEAYHKEGPYEAKGLGEAVLVPVSPAIANAVYNAIGVRIKDLPITREKILAGLRAPAEGS
ncbi:MAG: xanthine dehydrogenase family protein molybdopterin-binding subunit [Chloroflexi bacterium]|nr:xanthine dehydrogenase family protein molybdopterin-binding subunit [Chloroflexota bacterium]